MSRESTPRGIGAHSGNSFATTHWSVVLAAGQTGTAQSAAALESLCQAYWRPLYAYVRRRVSDLHEAQDLTQAFFAELLEKNYVGSATPTRGRFRTFLLTAFQHFLSKQWDRSRAQKRGGGHTRISLDFRRAETDLGVQPQMVLTPEQYYDRQWAVTLLDEIMGRLEQEFVERGKATQFQHLKGFVIGEHGESTYADVAARLEMSEAAVKLAAFRIRQRYRRLLREEIARTVVTVDEVDDEIGQLFTVLEIR